MAHKMLKPYSFLFYILAILAFFILGIMYASWTEAGKDQMLAGGAIVLGYGIVGAGIGLVLSLIGAAKLSKQSMYIGSAIMALFLVGSCFYFSNKYKARQAEREESNYIEKPLKPKTTAPAAVHDKLGEIQATTLLGNKLRSNPNPSAVYLENYEDAKLKYERHPNDAEALIWFGRRAGYLGNYNEAIDIFTRGIESHPSDAKMYRHRGHRYISIRAFEKSIADFTKAVSLIDGTENEIEPDGIPNAIGKPISTLHGNIWYHLALAHYLNRDFKNAMKAYEARFETNSNDDNIVSSGHWHYMTLRRMGLEKEAEKILEGIHENMDIIENHSYYDMCLFYKGLKSLEDIDRKNSTGSSDDVYLYGLANWYLYEKNDKAKAKEYLNRLLENGHMASFAYIAAEVDMKYVFSSK